MALRRGISNRSHRPASRAADIIVVGADGRDALADPFMQANPSDLIMQLGRPLLVVPESGKWLDLRSILIAWKATPEARRAIVDALPCYAKPRMSPSSKLSEDDVGRPAAPLRVKDIVAWLSRQAVVASEQVPGECGDAAVQLDKSRRRSAPALSWLMLMVIRGFGNGFSAT